MNEKLILESAMPYVRDGALTYDDFDKIFYFLSLKEQYAVTDILFKNGIGLVDEHISDNILILDIEDESVSAEDFDEENFDDLEDSAGFTAGSSSGSGYDDLVLNKNVRQSNEILCTLIQQGNRQAAQDLCVKNQKLVAKFVQLYAKRYGNRLDFEDLEQVGFIGLLKAAQKFSIGQGNAFSTYAVHWIKQSIAREIMDNGYAIRIPVHMMERINKVMAVSNRLSGDGIALQERIPMIAAELEYTEELVRECLVLKQNYLTYVSLDAPVGEENENVLGDFIPMEEDESVDQILMDKALRQEMASVLASLTPREQDILKLRVGWDDNNSRTLEEIGQAYGVTRERIRQIETKALRKMRHPSRARRLKAFWEE